MQGKSAVWFCSLAATTLPILMAGPIKAAVIYDPATGGPNVTASGFTGYLKPGDVAPKNQDYSVTESDAGTNGVWHINDNNTPNGNAYMRFARDPALDGYGLSASQGLVMARVKVLSSSSSLAGTFGYTLGGANISGMIGLRAGTVVFKDSQDGNTSTSTNYATDTTSDYRLYAIRYTTGNVINAWVSNGNSWSSAPGNWTQMVTNATFATNTALLDASSNKITGIEVGSSGSSGEQSNLKMDWVFFNKNDVDGDNALTPWDLNPLPEPATLLVLAAGLPWMARRPRRPS